MAALLIKESVNQTQDNQGFYNSLHACFTMHELNHAHWARSSTTTACRSPRWARTSPSGEGTKLKPAQRDTVEAS